jgi:hypothetical protein
MSVVSFGMFVVEGCCFVVLFLCIRVRGMSHCVIRSVLVGFLYMLKVSVLCVLSMVISVYFFFYGVLDFRMNRVEFI